MVVTGRSTNRVGVTGAGTHMQQLQEMVNAGSETGSGHTYSHGRSNLIYLCIRFHHLRFLVERDEVCKLRAQPFKYHLRNTGGAKEHL